MRTRREKYWQEPVCLPVFIIYSSVTTLEMECYSSLPARRQRNKSTELSAEEVSVKQDCPLIACLLYPGCEHLRLSQKEGMRELAHPVQAALLPQCSLPQPYIHNPQANM